MTQSLSRLEMSHSPDGLLLLDGRSEKARSRLQTGHVQFAAHLHGGLGHNHVFQPLAGAEPGIP